MVIGRIPLEVTNDRIFQDVALLIDRPDFQNDIKLLSERFKHESNPNSLLEEYLIPANQLRLISGLLSTYKYPPGFSHVIYALMIKGKITDVDVKDCYATTHLYSVVADEPHPYYPSTDEVLISIFPYTFKGKRKLVAKLLKEVVENIEDVLKPLPKNHPLNHNPIPSIRKKRELYWKSIEEKKRFRKLSKDLGENFETVRSRLTSCEKLLTIRL